jgi:hypothetical protein
VKREHWTAPAFMPPPHVVPADLHPGRHALKVRSKQNQLLGDPLRDEFFIEIPPSRRNPGAARSTLHALLPDTVRTTGHAWLPQGHEPLPWQRDVMGYITEPVGGTPVQGWDGMTSESLKGTWQE